MAESPTKEQLVKYLQELRDTVLWKLDGLDEYDLRRPLTPTGTSLLGMVKHLADDEFSYFGEAFGRPVTDLPGSRAATPGTRRTCSPAPTSPSPTSSAGIGARGSTRHRHLPPETSTHSGW